MTNTEIASALQPFFPFIAQVMAASWNDVLATVPVVGVYRRTERANVMHAAVRSNFDRLSHDVEPIFTLVSEPEGQGLDYLLVENGNTRFALRWGKSDGVRVRRNNTARTTAIQEQGYLFGEPPEPGPLPIVTIAYTVENDFTEAGVPRWRLDRLLLVRELMDCSEIIQEIHNYPEPALPIADDGPPPPRIVARDAELSVARSLFNSAG